MREHRDDSNFITFAGPFRPFVTATYGVVHRNANESARFGENPVSPKESALAAPWLDICECAGAPFTNSDFGNGR